MRNLIRISCICGGLALVLVLGNYVRRSLQPKPAEVIVFSVIGNRPFADSILSIWPDGSRVDRLLSPKADRSYLGASGNSLMNCLVVVVHENIDSKRTENHLYLYDPGSGAWQRLATMEGAEGYGALSPDNSRVVFEFEPKTMAGEKHGQGRLWMVELPSGQTKKLTTNDEEGTWDTLPAWRPDGEEITFLRCRLTQTGVLTKLMRVSREGGEPAVLAGGMVDACYSPDGKRMAMVAAGGLQIWDPVKNEQRLIVPWDTLPNHKYLAAGLTWSKTLNKIAFGTLNQRTGESELWTVSSEGIDAKKIYSTERGRISFPAFIKTK
ncbi:MAG TPA: hypothetical protein VIF64_08285 [Pyrinomonadaceae bacterium]|jgi:Tol biopolymer transport system component